MTPTKPIIIATRGSELALAQAKLVLVICRKNFPEFAFGLRIMKTTGDKLQTASLSQVDASLPKGLFTKELETALLDGRADLAVHSLKDLPTELPKGLELGATMKRADPRDVVIYKDSLTPGERLAGFPEGAVIATSSTRRIAQVQVLRPDFTIVPVRGNVPTRLQKLAESPDLDATILAAAGLSRLGYFISPAGALIGTGAPPRLRAAILNTSEMLPCVGQGAIGLEIRENDQTMAAICQEINHSETFSCIAAERSLLHALGGGCQTPVGAFARISCGELSLQAISFLEKEVRRAQGSAPISDAVALGERIAFELKAPIIHPLESHAETALEPV